MRLSPRFSVFSLFALSLLVINFSKADPGEAQKAYSASLENVNPRAALIDAGAAETVSGVSLSLISQVGGQPNAVAVQGSLVYVGIGQRLAIVDVSMPNLPVLVGQTKPFGGSIRAISLSGTLAFTVDSSSSLRIFDVSEPAAPREVGSRAMPGDLRGITLLDSYAYVASAGEGLQILDIANPASPVIVGSYNTPGSAEDVAGSDPYIYVADGNAGLRIVDVSTPSAPREVGFLVPLGTASSLSVAGSYVYVTNGSAGVRVIDVSSPAAPYEVGFFQTPGEARNIVIADARAYVTGTGSSMGLQVLDISVPSAPRSIGMFLPYDPLGKLSYAAAWEISVAGSHAYAGDATSGLRVIDIANPALPKQMGAYDTSDGANAVSISGNAALVAGDLGLHIIDVHDITAPREIGHLTTTPPFEEETIRILFLSGTRAYLASGDWGVRIVDVSDLGSPREIGSFKAGYPVSVSVDGNLAYTANAPFGLKIVDISDPQAPEIVGSFGASYADYALDVVKTGHYAYLARWSGLQIVDVSDPTTPHEVGFYSAPYLSGFCVVGSFVYIPSGSAGLRIVDISTPTAPREVGFYDTPGSASAVFVDGPYAYVVDGFAGLRVVDVSDPTAPREVGHHDTPSGAKSVFAENDVVYVTHGKGGLSIFRAAPTVTATIGASGGRLYSAPDQVTYSFEPGTFTGDVMVTHKRRFAEDTPVSANLSGIGRVFEASAAYSSSGLPALPTRTFTVTVQYADSGQGAALGDALALYAWNGAEWIKEPSSAADPLNHTITATPNRLSLWAVLGDSRRVFLPIVSRNYSPDVDIAVDHVEVTQAVQDLSNSVPLVTGRPTVLRVYGRTSATTPTTGVYLTVTASRNGQALAGSPIRQGPLAVVPEPSRGKLSDSFNVVLPQTWLEGDVVLETTIVLSPDRRETYQDNNTAAIAIHFNPVPALSLKLVPINYTDTPTGKFFSAPTFDTNSEWLLHAYPISELNVSWHTPVSFQGDLNTWADVGRLLDLIFQLKTADGAPQSQVYVAIIPEAASTGLGMASSARAAVAPQRRDGFLLVHEIGHALGLGHAPGCGAPSPDPQYPYSATSIGQYGLDIFRWVIPSPNSMELAWAREAMSYCAAPWWFSDYHYRKLFIDQRDHGSSASGMREVPSMLIHATLDADERLTLHPVYVLSMRSGDKSVSSEYSVELVAPGGASILSQPVPVLQAEEGGAAVWSIHASIPVLSQPVAEVRVLRAGILVARRVLRAFPAAAAVVPEIQQADDGIVLIWGSPETPALVRYTVNNGLSWTTLGLDVLGGTLRVDPATLPGGAGRFDITLADEAMPASLQVPLPRSLPDNPPQIRISGQVMVPADQPLILTGLGTDREDEALLSMVWLVDGQKAGAGPLLQIDGLTAGEHIVVFQATDTAGHVVRAEQRINVTSNTELP